MFGFASFALLALICAPSPAVLGLRASSETVNQQKLNHYDPSIVHTVDSLLAVSSKELSNRMDQYAIALTDERRHQQSGASREASMANPRTQSKESITDDIEDAFDDIVDAKKETKLSKRYWGGYYSP
jgi:hypothetical protein